METPTVNSLLLADHVYRDQHSGKWIVAGVFNTVRAEAYPCHHDRLDIFFQLTNVKDAVDLHLRIEHAETGDVLLDLGGPITAPNPLDVIEQTISVRALPISKPGKYWVQLVSDEEILTQAPLHAKLIRSESDQERPTP
jgi:hypothetical protein